MSIPPSEASEPGGRSNRAQRLAGRLTLLGFGSIALFFLLAEYRAHLFAVLPYLLLAACPLMHLFHHRGHGHHGGASRHRRSDSVGSPTQDGFEGRK